VQNLHRLTLPHPLPLNGFDRLFLSDNATLCHRWQKVGEDEEHVEKHKKTAQVQDLPGTQPVPPTGEGEEEEDLFI
jgi:hypothetical protein